MNREKSKIDLWGVGFIVLIIIVACGWLFLNKNSIMKTLYYRGWHNEKVKIECQWEKKYSYDIAEENDGFIITDHGRRILDGSIISNNNYIGLHNDYEKAETKKLFGALGIGWECYVEKGQFIGVYKVNTYTAVMVKGRVPDGFVIDNYKNLMSNIGISEVKDDKEK